MPLFRDLVKRLTDESNSPSASPNDSARLLHCAHLLRLYSTEDAYEPDKLLASHAEHVRLWLNSLPTKEVLKLMAIYIRENTCEKSS